MAINLEKIKKLLSEKGREVDKKRLWVDWHKSDVHLKSKFDWESISLHPGGSINPEKDYGISFQRSGVNMGAYKPVTQTWTGEDVIKLYHRIMLLKSSQRSSGYELYSGWDENMAKPYIMNKLRGKTINRILLASIPHMRVNSSKAGEAKDAAFCEEVIKYWLETMGREPDINEFRIDEGGLFSILDTNNSLSWYAHFLDGKVPDENGNYFTDYDKASRSRILFAPTFEAMILEGCTLAESCAIFTDINQSKHLNPQEERSSTFEKTNVFLRRLSEEPESIFLTSLWNSNVDLAFDSGLIHETLVTKYAYLVDPRVKRNGKHLTKLNTSKEIQKEKLEELLEMYELMCRILFKSVVTNQGKTTFKKSLWSKVDDMLFFVFLKKSKEHGYKIPKNKYVDFVSEYLRTLKDLRDLATKLRLENPEEGQTYDFNKLTHNGCVDTSIDEAADILWYAFYRKQQPNNPRGPILVKIRSHKDRYTVQQGLLKLSQQGFKRIVGESDDGTDIYEETSILDYYCVGGDFHMDHIYPVSKGGQTTIDNLQITSKKYNLSKSDRLPTEGESK